MTDVFYNTLMTVLNKYIPNKIFTFNDRDPPWMTREIKTAIKRKHRVYKKFNSRGRNPADWERIRILRNETTYLVDAAKDNYFKSLGRKLTDTKTGIKAYWQTINKILNKNKVTCIPPLLEDDVFVTNFQTKAAIFNEHFVQQCSLINNSSQLPAFISKTSSVLEKISIDSAKILSLIRSLNTNKAHGWDDLSISMIKICDHSIVRPLCLIYERCIESGQYPQAWKRANVLPIHKKENRQLKKNYRPISLLPICGKIFEKLVFDVMYEFLNKNNLLTPKQSGFRPGDSTINQLLSITNEIHKAFDKYPSRETRAIFLDISKAFDKVWHEGLIFKLKSNAASGKLLDLIKSFLSERYQRVVLNGKSSSWKPVPAGVPQGSVLGPLFFLVYINDLADNLVSDVRLFADDTSLFTIVYDETVSAQVLNSDLKTIEEWAYQWKMQFNPDVNKQAVQVIFSQKKSEPFHPPLFFNGSLVPISYVHKHLGFFLDSELNFLRHVKEAITKARKGIGVIRFMAKYVTRDVLDQMYKLYVRPHSDYGDVIYHRDDPEMNSGLTKRLESVQYSAALAVAGAWKGTSYDKLLDELGWEYLYRRRWFRRLSHFYSIVNGNSPEYLKVELPQPKVYNYNLRSEGVFERPHVRTQRFGNTFFPYCIREWNELHVSIRTVATLSQFKNELIKCIRPPKRSTFKIDDILGIKLITRIRLGFSHLREHKHRHNFPVSPICSCGTEPETTEHFLLRCQRFSRIRSDMLDNACELAKSDLTLLSDELLSKLLLYGDHTFNDRSNQLILLGTITFIRLSERFKIDDPSP